MHIPRVSGKAPFSVLVSATLFLGLVMLYFGIRFKGYRPANNIEWLPAGEGLCFNRFAIAYTTSFFPPADAASRDAGLTIELAFRSMELTSGNFGYLLSVYAGDDRSQLLIGQWRHWLLIMNGADHDGRQGVKKVQVDISGTEGHTHLLTIASGRKGTSVYLNGKLARTESSLQLFYPFQPGLTRLTLGNSVYGQHPWHGLVAGLALYDVAVDPEVIRGHEAQRTVGTLAGKNRGAAPRIQYRFDVLAGELVANIAGENYPLHVPERMVILKKEFLGWHEVLNSRKWSIVQDVGINLLGFVPLGWMLCATLSRLGGFAGRRYLWLAIGLACAFSLSLEVAQAWIPSRDSSLIDLVMNTFGATVGGWIYSLGGLVQRLWGSVEDPLEPG